MLFKFCCRRRAQSLGPSDLTSPMSLYTKIGGKVLGWHTALLGLRQHSSRMASKASRPMTPCIEHPCHIRTAKLIGLDEHSAASKDNAYLVTRSHRVTRCTHISVAVKKSRLEVSVCTRPGYLRSDSSMEGGAYLPTGFPSRRAVIDVPVY